MIGIMMKNRFFTLCALGAAMLTSCIGEITPECSNPAGSGEIKIVGIAQGIVPVNVDTRANERESAEQQINNMHVFLFDADGNYLQPKIGERFQGYTSATEYQNTIRIDNKAFLDEDKARNATVVVVANVQDGTFIIDGPGQTPRGIDNLSDLLNYYYAPEGYSFLEELPQSGMPMFACLEGQNLVEPQTNVLSVTLKALMAKIKIDLSIDSEHGDNKLPSFTFTSWEVSGMPDGVYLTSDATTTTTLPEGHHYETMTRNSIRSVYNKGGKISRYFYVFENILYKKGNYNYPAGIPEDDKQFYKPQQAPDNSVLLTLKGRYVTYDGLNYDVTYKLYIGGNNYDDFAVVRNHQYNSNVVIHGITHSNSSSGDVSLDTRVDVQQSTPVYISLLRQRNLDSHFNVVPMDIFWLGDKGEATVDVAIEDPATNTWVRFEKVPASEMQAADFAAGTGKRQWFTTDLVTNTLASNTGYTDLQDKDRIYLYIDENISTKPRSANLLITYNPKDNTPVTTKILLEQRGLMEVIVYENNNGAPRPGEPVRHYLYIEDIEEYLHFYDPYSEYSTELHFEGLPWGCRGGEVKDYKFPYYTNSWTPSRNRIGSDPWMNIFDGMQYTYNIINQDMINNRGNYTGAEFDSRYSMMTLNDKPRTAAEYCMNKNKRNADGKIPYKTYEDVNNSGQGVWYMPGIRELEAILRAYYTRYPEFQNNWYWSSAAGEKDTWLGIDQDNNRARATKAKQGTGSGFAYEESGHAYPYEEGKGGSADRNNAFRIRAAYGPFKNRPSWAN